MRIVLALICIMLSGCGSRTVVSRELSPEEIAEIRALGATAFFPSWIPSGMKLVRVVIGDVGPGGMLKGYSLCFSGRWKSFELECVNDGVGTIDLVDSVTSGQSNACLRGTIEVGTPSPEEYGKTSGVHSQWLRSLDNRSFIGFSGRGLSAEQGVKILLSLRDFGVNVQGCLLDEGVTRNDGF